MLPNKNPYNIDPRNAIILDYIAMQIIDDLNSAARNRHIEVRTWHENAIMERSVSLSDDYVEECRFEDIFELYVGNPELQNLYDALETSSQNYVKAFVRDVYPEWRHSMG